MFILFGFGKRTIKELGETKPIRCGRCSNVRSWQYKKYTTWFTLFFVPLIPYKNMYVKECPICHTAQEVDKETIDSNIGGPNINRNSEGQTEVQKNYLKQMEEFKQNKE